MHISLDGFVVGSNGEMNWIKVDEEIFDHVVTRQQVETKSNDGNTMVY